MIQFSTKVYFLGVPNFTHFLKIFVQFNKLSKQGF